MNNNMTTYLKKVCILLSNILSTMIMIIVLTILLVIISEIFYFLLCLVLFDQFRKGNYVPTYVHTSNNARFSQMRSQGYQDQWMLEQALKNMPADQKKDMAKLLSTTPSKLIGIQTVEQLTKHYGKEKVNEMNDVRFKNQRKVHELKLDPMYFRDLELGYKTFEIRKDDRPFRINDMLLLQSFDRKNQEYTGSMIFASIVGIFGREEHEKEFVKEGYVILSIDIVKSRYVQD